MMGRGLTTTMAQCFSQTSRTALMTGSGVGGTTLKEKLAFMRQRTEAGIMECKKALEQHNMDPEEALKSLSEKAKSAKGREGRVLSAASIAIASRQDGSGVALVEGTSETDFVAKNDLFQSLLLKLSRHSLLLTPSPSSKAVLSLDGASSLTALDIAELLNQRPTETGDEGVANFQEVVSKVIFSTGENVVIRRASILQTAGDQTKKGSVVVTGYTHGDGRVATALALCSPTASLDTLKSFGRDLAVHVAACSPKAIDRDHAASLGLADLSADDLFVSQSLIVDDSLTVAQSLSKHNATISSFVRWERGELIE